MTLKFISLLSAAAFVIAVANPEQHTNRILEGEDGNSYVYLNDVSSYSIQFGKCVRVKVPQENDDDTEGNAYFYNGRYHAQYMRYATFHLCQNNGKGCDCDYSVQYATEMNQYLNTMVTHLDNYCGQCNAYCGNRRWLEENDDGAGAVDCSTCSNDCALYNQKEEDDETQYLYCSEAYVGDDGVQYYSAPQCDSDGNIEIGMFYDEECTVKTKGSLDFNYYVFQSVTEMCMDCANGDDCEDLYGESYHCQDGQEVSGNQDGDMPVCYAVGKATISREYSGGRRKSKTDKFLTGFFIILAVSLFGVFFFLTYTYYIRHRGERSLISQDHDVTGEALSPQSQTTLT